MASRKGRSPAQIPDKAYFRIGEVARVAGVAPSVLRFWETQFRSLRPEKTRTNQRVYSRRHVEAVLRIRELLYDRGFTISGAQRHLRGQNGDDGTPPAELTTQEPLSGPAASRPDAAAMLSADLARGKDDGQATLEPDATLPAEALSDDILAALKKEVRDLLRLCDE